MFKVKVTEDILLAVDFSTHARPS